MMDSMVRERCSNNNNNNNSNNSRELVKHLARIYHSIYVYVSVFAITFGLLLYGIRQRIYSLPLSWGTIASLYSLASLLALLLALACYYFVLVCRHVATQCRIQCLMKTRAEILKNFPQMPPMEGRGEQKGEESQQESSE